MRDSRDGTIASRSARGEAARPAGAMHRRVDPHLVTLVAPRSFEAEQYLKLRHAVERLRRSSTGFVVGVCSPVPGDGKSLTAFNLAGALAQDPAARVILIDADLRRQSASLKDALPLADADGPGLVDAIIEPQLPLNTVARRLPAFNLFVVPTGGPAAAPYELLHSPHCGALIAEARRLFDYVVLDTPPILPVSDCQAIARWVDGFLLVVSAHRTPRRLLKEALDLMDDDKVIGIVFNRDQQQTRHYYGNYDYGERIYRVSPPPGAGAGRRG